MISLDPRELMREVHASAKARDDRLRGVEELLRRYPGSWWSGVPGHGQFDPENASFELVSYLSSQLVWQNPRVSVSTRRPVAQQEVAEAMHWGLNRWITDTDYKTHLDDLVVDYLFGWAVGHTTLAPRQEHHESEDPPLWPQTSRLDPRDFGYDHLCPTWRRARLLWHRWSIDKDDLVKRARLDAKRPKNKREGWDVGAVEGLSTTGGHRTLLGVMRGDRNDERVDRKEVELVEIYIPEVQLDGEPGPEHGFNGTIVTLGVAGALTSPADGVIVRPPRPFFGPRWGPYTVFGTYVVPGSPFPLSLLLATAGHIELASRAGVAIDKSIAAYANMLITTDQELAQLIVDGKQDNVYTARNLASLQDKVATFAKGGPTREMLQSYELIRERRNRAMGLDDVQRGIVTGAGTATEVSEAVQAAGARVAQVKNRFQDGARRELKTISWYLFHTDEIEFGMGKEASEAMGAPEGTEAFFEGGTFEAGSGTTFDDLGLEIEPYSMERPTEQTKILRASFYTNVLPVIAPILPQLVAAGWKPKPMLDAIGDAYQVHNLSDQVDMERLAEAAQQPPEGEDPMPRLLRDIGLTHQMAGEFGQPKKGGTRGGPKPMGKVPSFKAPSMAPVATESPVTAAG